MAAILFAACSPGDGGSTATTSAEAVTTSVAPATTGDIEGGATTTAATETPTTTQATSDRPVAPDFTLELGDGGTYTLSEGTKPVYLVFWAEW